VAEETLARLARLFEETLNMPAPAPDEDIIETGLLDSLGLVTLLFEIEQEYGLQIPLESLDIDDFRSLGGIARLLTSKVSAP
jgi:acyl carrier protein